MVSNFIVQALANEPITIFGEGQQTRSFCFVSDLVRGLTQLMDTPDDFTGPVNIGNPVEFTILQLAEKVIALTGSSSKLIKLSYPCPKTIPNSASPISAWPASI